MNTKKPTKLIIWLSVIFLSFIWGSTWLAIKVGLTDSPPFLSASLRFIIASLFLIVYMRYKKLKFPIHFKFLKRSFLLALFMFVIPYGFVYWGEMYISSGLSSVLFSSQSLFVVLCAHYMLKDEKASLVKWIGLLTGMCGLLYIFYSRFEMTSDFGIIGMAGIVLAAISAGFALVWLRKSGEISDHITELTSQIIITAIMFLAVSMFSEEVPQNLNSSTTWICVFYLAIVGTSIAFLIFYWLAKHTSALVVSFSIYFTPVLALFLGWFFLDETISYEDIIGTIIVIISIFITQTNNKISKFALFNPQKSK